MALHEMSWDEGSFRDPDGSVFYFDNRVYRTVSKSRTENIKKLLNAPFFQELVSDGRLVKTQLVDKPSALPLSEVDHILEHEKIPFITYPYEWSFHMRKDAALLTLEILKKALENGFVLKDGTAWNVTHHKGKMCFFDILSVDTYKEGQAWNGYMQFCQEFLYPLMLESYKKVDVYQFLHSNISGIDAKTAYGFFSARDWFTPGVFKHLFLNSKFAKSKSVATLNHKNAYFLPKKALINNIDNLYAIISKLDLDYKGSVWGDYEGNNTYLESDSLKKKNFIEGFLKNVRPQMVIDLGCNTGEFSRLAQRYSTTFACDLDPVCVDKLYKQVQKNDFNIIPFVQNLMRPSPDMGWFLKERKSILNRIGKIDSFFALALIHHLCIASNVPLESFVLFLSKISPSGVVEWVEKEDPMVQLLLRNREDIFKKYTKTLFETLLSKYFRIIKTQDLNKGFRTLYWLEAL